MMNNEEKHEWIDLSECEICHETNDTVRHVPDPFEEQVHGDDTSHWLCADCQRDRQDAV